MRATAQDPEAAKLMGINVDTTISLTFLLGGLLAGAAGLINTLYQTSVWYFQGFTAGLIAFTAAVMGGIGNLRGAVLGGVIIGMHPAGVRQPDRQRMDAGGDLRLPGPDHGVQAAGADRRGDEGGRMNTLRELRKREWTKYLLPAVVLLAVALFPLFRPPLDGFMDDCILALAYVVMALGLNLVVGFAGLLDLGYVAFYALGAMAVGWWASDFYTGVGGDEAASTSA